MLRKWNLGQLGKAGILVGVMILGVGMLTAASPDDRVPLPPRVRPEAKSSAILPPLSPSPREGDAPNEVPPAPRPSPPRASTKLIGTASPGLRISLDGSSSTGEGLWYRWVQVQGSPTTLDAADRPVASLAVPAGASELGFLLIVGNSSGADFAPIAFAVEAPGRSAGKTVPRADAGDDQIGQVGKQITLNGIRSTPKGKLGYRWISVAGPRIDLKIEEGHVFTFVPPANGLYRFALVVASGSEMSDPDYVDVAVGVPLPPSSDPVPASSAPPLKELAKNALTSMDGGPSAGTDLADAFEAVGERLELYHSYSELMIELTRRLEDVVPPEAARRSAWMERVFAPLTARLIEQMRAEGLDLARPDGQTAEMTRPQRKVLADQFRAMAEGFRSAGGDR